jgi:hypothetical protein
LERVDLREAYPPARRALENIRDEKTESLMKGTCDLTLFHDVASINPAFGQVERTSDLFKTIAGSNRGFAEKCFQIVLESLIRTKEFGLARSFIPDPQKQIEEFAMPLKLARGGTSWVSPEIVQETLVRIYVKNVNLVLHVLLGVGDQEASDHLREYALECVPDAQLRDRIREGLDSSTPSKQIQ